MDLLLTPSRQISGEVFAPPSKSYAHRFLICAFLSKTSGYIKNVGGSKDVLATLTALSSVGLKYDLSGDGVSLSYAGWQGEPILDCFESGSTIRFLLPVISALGIKCEFTGSQKLLSRPMSDLITALNENGAEIDGFRLNGKLKSGEFKITGKISSQFISGLLFALPLLDGDSKIIIEGEKVSKDYIAITLEVLKVFGVEATETEYGYLIKGNQTYIMPKDIKIEGDYSGASFLLALGVLGGSVKVLNLNKNTSQGDKEIVSALKKFGGNITEVEGGYLARKSELKGASIDCEDIPDLVQILSVVASYSKGVTTLKNVTRLKIKESDRIEGIIKNLKIAGIKAEYDGCDLTVYGGKPTGGIFCSDNDHRTVMSATVLATFASGNSQILGAEAVQKSYGDFFKDYSSVGGIINGDI